MAFRHRLVPLLLVRRSVSQCESTNKQTGYEFLVHQEMTASLPRRGMGSLVLYSSDSATEGEDTESSALSLPKDGLNRRIFRLRSPRRSAAAAIDEWIGEGKGVKQSEFRTIAKQLARYRRYEHALEILDRLDAKVGFSRSAADRAIRMECMINVHGLSYCEKYFENLHDSASQKATFMPLLHSYVKDGDVQKSEALMSKLLQLGLAVDAHPFNEIMKLYMAKMQFKRVLLVIQQMKQNMIPLNVLSYNLWMNACASFLGVGAAEKVYEEMVINKNVEVGWSTLSTLANIYVNANLTSKALAALSMAEEKLSPKKHLGSFFLLTLHATLKNEEGVLRIWALIRRTKGRLTNTNYMCILLSLVKVSNLGEAETAFRTWESKCHKYDIRVSNVLLGAYMRKGWMEKVESLHLHTMRKGGRPNYKTWEILVEGWVKTKQMDRAVEAMKRAFPKLKGCDWRPSPSILLAVAEYFELQRNVADATRYIKMLHQQGLTNGPLYKSLLRLLRSCGGSLSSEIFEMIEKDEVELDPESQTLIQELNDK